MTSISRLTRITILTAFAVGLAGCMHWEDPIAQYAKRSDKLTLSAGNSVASNEAIHVVDPWPRASADRRIPANGERMAGAHERYRNVDKSTPRPMIIPPSVVVSGGGTAGGAAPAAAPIK